MKFNPFLKHHRGKIYLLFRLLVILQKQKQIKIFAIDNFFNFLIKQKKLNMKWMIIGIYTKKYKKINQRFKITRTS